MREIVVFGFHAIDLWHAMVVLNDNANHTRESVCTINGTRLSNSLIRPMRSVLSWISSGALAFTSGLGRSIHTWAAARSFSAVRTESKYSFNRSRSAAGAVFRAHRFGQAIRPARCDLRLVFVFAVRSPPVYRAGTFLQTYVKGGVRPESLPRYCV